METNSNGKSERGPKITIDIPPPDDGLFRSDAVGDVLLFLARHHDEAFSITELAESVGFSRPTITKTVDVLSRNDLVVEERAGSRRMVGINPERLSLPNDPYLQIPQAEFHEPVKAAAERLIEELDGVLGVVLYGSVARGEADRRSDVDLWVLVRTDRMSNQRRANRVREGLEDDEFDSDRYAFEIDVEALRAVPNYVDELRDVLRDGIALHRTAEFDAVREMVLRGGGDE